MRERIFLRDSARAYVVISHWRVRGGARHLSLSSPALAGGVSLFGQCKLALRGNHHFLEEVRTSLISSAGTARRRIWICDFPEKAAREAAHRAVLMAIGASVAGRKHPPNNAVSAVCHFSRRFLTRSRSN